MQKHLAIFKGDTAKLILEGKKTVESRFSQAKIPPFGRVSRGDLVYIKPSGEEIIGQFRVQKVIFYDGLCKEDIQNIKNLWGNQIAVDGSYWEERLNAKYATLLFISQVQRFITSPVKFPKKDLRGWVVFG